jgi:signal transduction protein with GAF and PtsI domain
VSAPPGGDGSPGDSRRGGTAAEQAVPLPVADQLSGPVGSGGHKGEIRKRGVAASPGIAIGRAYVVDRRRKKVPKKHVGVEDVEMEIARLNKAISESDVQLAKIKERLVGATEDHSFILEAHQLILHDEHVVDEAIRHIKEDRINAEWALTRTIEHIKQIFDGIEDDYFRERRSDIDFVGDRIMRNLLGEDVGPPTPPPDAIVVANDLSPADTAQLHRAAVAALITDAGGKTSHTAIIARAHEIPAVVGLEDVTSVVGTGDLVIVDGSNGLVLLNPAKRPSARPCWPTATCPPRPSTGTACTWWPTSTWSTRSRAPSTTARRVSVSSAPSSSSWGAPTSPTSTSTTPRRAPP